MCWIYICTMNMHIRNYKALNTYNMNILKHTLQNNFDLKMKTRHALKTLEIKKNKLICTYL